jgi:hypothetical protein
MIKMKYVLPALIALLALITAALAQQPVELYLPSSTPGNIPVIVNSANPLPVSTGTSAGATSTQTKVTITTAGTYQQYLAANTARKGCTIQFITASHTGYVFFGAAPADTTTSWQLGPGQSLNCNVGSVVLTDAIQLTSSNNSDIFVVNSY